MKYNCMMVISNIYHPVFAQQQRHEETVISMDSVIFERFPLPIGRYHLKEMACNEIDQLDLCENCSGFGG